MCNIIIEKEATANLKQFLINNYKEKNVAFITTEKILNKNKENLLCLKNLPLQLEVFFLEDFARCDKVNTELIKESVKDSDFIVCFGYGDMVDAVKYVATECNKKYALVVSMIDSTNYILNFCNFINADGLSTSIKCELPECVYIDINIIEKTPKRYVANAFAYVLSFNLMLCKMLYDNFDDIKIKELSDIIKEINIFTDENIITMEGKTKLIKLILELQLKLNELKIDYPVFKLCSFFNKFYNKNLSLLNGELCLIFSFLILSLQECVLNNKICLSPLNINKRISRLKYLFKKDNYVTEVVSNLESTNTEKMLQEIAEKKELFLKYITLALNRITNNISMLKRIYIDKGVVLNNVNMESFYNTLSLASDFVEERFLTTLRDVGVMDNI